MRYAQFLLTIGLLSYCLGLSVPVWAQQKTVTRVQSPVRLGLTGGIRLGGLMSMPTGSGLRYLPPGAKVVTFQSRYGFLGGIVGQFRFSPELAIATEALVNTRGFKRSYDFPLTQRQEDLQVRQLCLDLPIFFRYNLQQFYAELGLVNTIVLRTNYEQEIRLPDEKTTSSGELADARSFNLSAAAGVGVETVDGYLFGARFLYGLSKLGQTPGATAEVALSGERLTSFSVQLSAGYIFRHQSPETGGPLKHGKGKKKKRR